MSAGLCIAAAGVAALLEVASFTLAWEHSIEKVEWRERWQVTAAGLVLSETRIEGTGAGMEPPPSARLADGWFAWHPSLLPQAELIHPDSDFAPPLRLCLEGKACRPLRSFLPGSAPADAPLVLRPALPGSPCKATPLSPP